MKSTIYLTAFVSSLMAFSCSPGGNNQSETETTVVREETDTLSQLEKEHLLLRDSYADSVNRGYLPDTFTGSARREASGQIGDTEVTINYGSPGVRGRVIWNGLVSYDQVWVSGSHWATAVHFSDEVHINDQSVKPGWYGFFTIPGREKWTLILNENYDQHLAEEYDQAEDLLRLETTPITLEDTVQRLTYDIKSTAEGEGILSMSWDKVRLELPIKAQ